MLLVPILVLYFATRAEGDTLLVKNITALLDTILDNYDKKFRPDHDNISVRSMGPISERDMEFSLDCYFRQKWKDERLKFDSPIKRLSLAHKFVTNIWKPDTYIKNGRRAFLHKLTTPNVLLRVNHDGVVIMSQRLTIKARCPMYLRKFPMDTQACPITIGSLAYGNEDIIYRWNQVSLESEFGHDLSQYKVLALAKWETNISNLRGCEFGCEISILSAYFKLQRQQGYYVLQIYIPCSLLVVMSWVSFWINREASPARVMVGVMTVLNMCSLGLGHREELPRVSYATALDIFVLACFGFVFAALVEYALVNFGDIYFGKQLRKKRRSMREEIKIQRRKKILSWKRAVDNIDSVSKVLFPFLYTTFLVVYWVAYLYLIPDEIVEKLLKSEKTCGNSF